MSEGNAIDIDILFGHDQDVMAAQIATMWTLWASARSGALSRWTELLKYIYATSTRDTTNETTTDWSNTTHRPKLANLFDTLTINYDSALFPNPNWLVWEGSDEDSAAVRKRQIVESYMRTKHRLRESGFREAVRRLEEDWVAYGNAFAQVDYVNELIEDPLTGDVVTAYVGPRVTRIDPRDIVMNPKADSSKMAPKIIRKLFTIAELHRIVEQNPNQPHFRKILEVAQFNRGRIRQFDKGDIDKDTLLAFDGFGTTSQYFESGLVEVLDFYGDIYEESTETFRKNHVITVVDRFDIVRDEPIDSWTGRPHIFHVGWRNRNDNVWAQGPLDNLVGMQFRMDHLENARADAFDQMIDPDIVFAGDVEDIVQVGGARHYHIVEGGNVSHLRPDTTVLNADFQIGELEQSMERFALAPREALGIRSPGEKTAFEVAELQNASGRAFQHKVNIFQEFLEDIVNAELELAVKHLDGTDVVEVVDDDTGAIDFRTITREDVTARGKLVPIGARHFARNAQLVQNLTQLQLGPLTDPEVAQHFSSVGLAELIQEFLDLQNEKKTLVSPYIRIEERLEAQRRTQVAQDQALQESQTSVDEPDVPGIRDEISGARGNTLNLGGFGNQ